MVLGFWARRQLTKDTDDHVPTKLQMIWETVVNQVNSQVEDNLGTVNPFVVPLAVALFFFILIANWLEMIPTELNRATRTCCPRRPPTPTSPTRMALLVMVGVWTYGIRKKGVKGYFKHFLEPYPCAAPAQRHRGAHQADHAGPATLRQHLRRRHHARADRG